MGITEVEQTILRDARERAEEELKRARAEAARILANARQQLEREQAGFDAHTKQLLDVLERREIARAATHRKALLLEARSESLTEAFAAAKHELTQGSEQTRKAFLQAALARAAQELSDVQRIECNPRDEALVQKLTRTKTVSASKDIDAGIIAHESSGRVRSELTVGTILHHVQERKLPTIARILFEQNTSGSRRQT